MFISLYKTHKEKVHKTQNELNGESSESLRREESRSPLALPELRLYLTRCCRCYRRVTRSEVIPRIRTQSVPSFICGNTQTKQKVINFMSYKYNLVYLSVIRAYSLFSYDVFLYWTLRDFRPSE